MSGELLESWEVRLANSVSVLYLIGRADGNTLIEDVKGAALAAVTIIDEVRAEITDAWIKKGELVKDS